jgi:hypothetical protein
MEVSGQVHGPAALPPGSSTRYPLYKRLGEPQDLYGYYGEEKNLLPLPEIEPRFLGRPARSLVDVPTELSPLPERRF